MIRGIWGDFRLASRSLCAAPVVTFAAIVTLALGLGAITAMFSMVNAVMLRPLPVNEPQRLVTVTSSTALKFGFQAGAGWNYRMWDQLRQRRDVFDGAFAWTVQSVDLGSGGEMRPASALFATGDLFATLGVQAMLGRTFTSADDERGGGPDGPVVVISYDFWQRRFNRMPGVIGTRLPVEGIPFTIIGVTPSRFFGVDVGQAFDLALPLGTEPLIRGSRALIDNERALLLTVMLRLEPGQSGAQATAALRAMQPEIIGSFAQPPAFLKEPFLVVPAARGISDRSGLRQKYDTPLLAITIVAGLVLLIVCVNVANLLLARAAARRHELSVRLALGAPRLRLARQFLVEGFTLGTIAAALGLAFAGWTSRALATQLQGSAGPVRLDVPLDWRVLGFTAVVTVVAVALFGSLPALLAARVPSGEVLRSGGRGTQHGRLALSAAPIVAQVAISLVLVAGAGLFVRTLNRLASVPLGFNPNGLIVIAVSTARPVTDPAARLLLYQRIIDATTSVAGVTSAAGSVWTPMGGGGGGLLTDARGRRADPNRSDGTAFNFVSPGWFDTYATSRRAGRDISGRDDGRAQRVAIVNEALSRRLFQDRSGLGETIEAGPCGRSGCTVIGVVADALYSASLRDGPPPTVYLPLAQSAGLTPRGTTSIQITVRTGDNMRVVPAIADALRAIDRTLVFKVRSLETDVAAALTQERLVAKLAAFFGLVALLLTALGLYGIVAYAVSVRRTEIGIRLALGAQPGGVVVLVMRRVCLLGVAGLGLGLAASLWLSRFVAPLVYGLEPRDSASLITALLTLAAVGAIAAWIPASRAAHVDPAQVLRTE